MKAMVLSAGLGRRMWPLTLTSPKAVLPVLGRPLVVQVLQRLSRFGIEEAVLNLHHLPDVIEGVLAPGCYPDLPSISFSREPEILGTAGGILQAAPLLDSDETIVATNSDFLADIDLDAALSVHRRSGALATLVLAPLRAGYSTVDVDVSGRVLALAGEPARPQKEVAASKLFTGLHLIEPEVIERIPRGRPSDIVRDVYRGLAAERRLGSYTHEGWWWEFGTPANYLRGSLDLLDCSEEKRRDLAPVHDTVRIEASAAVAVGPGVRWEPSARIRGRAALGFMSYVSEDTLIEDTVVMPEAWVGPGCHLDRVIVGSGTELPAGFSTRRSVVCPDPGGDLAAVPGAERVNGLIVMPFDPVE